MRYLITAIFICCALSLSGCGSLLATLQTEPIEDHPGDRTLGQLIGR